MNDGFKVSKDLTLPSESVCWVFAFLAKRNAGKTYCAADLAEEMLKAKVPIVVVDTMGIWWGLRVGKTGEGPGLPIVVFGGDHGDLPLVPEKAKQIAKAVVEANISAVLDLSAMSKRQTRLVAIDFLDELYKLNRVERHVFIEETDVLAPQRTIGPEMATCLGAVDNFVRRGGNHNLGCTMITQRSAVLSKDILTQSDTLVVLRTLAPQDKKAIQAWVEEQTDEDKRKLHEWYDSLKQLPNGMAWIWHPEKPAIFKKVMFRERETFHATRKFLLSPKAATIQLMDVGEFIQKFRNVFEPKPKPQPTPKLEPKIVKIVPPISLQAQGRSELPKAIEAIERKLPSEATEFQTSKSATFVHQVPNVTLLKERPMIQVPSEPSSPVGKVLVVLMNNKLNDWRWTGKKIKNLIRAHEWPEDGADEAIAELARWEILVVQSNHYLHFNRNRVRVVEHETVREVN